MLQVEYRALHFVPSGGQKCQNRMKKLHDNGELIGIIGNRAASLCTVKLPTKRLLEIIHMHWGTERNKPKHRPQVIFFYKSSRLRE